MLTFERSTRLRELARALPLEAMVLETDAPDMTVFQHHGERNSPEYLPYCLAALAEVRNEDPEEVARVTTANVRDVLSLDANVNHHNTNRASLLPPGEGQDEGI